jgi:hypothetical protein
MPKESELIKYIWSLRFQENMPLHFRRKIEGQTTLWFVYYGYMVIAYRADQKTDTHAVEVAANVHQAIYKSKTKAA